MYMRIIAAMVIAAFICTAAYGQEAPQDAIQKAKKSYTMQEMVVTESKVLQSEENVTQQIDVIPEQEIQYRTLTNRNLSEIFLYEPGIFVNPLSRNDANWGSFGGLGPKYNVYLLDGLPVDSFVDPMSLDPWVLQRAEVFKGPASIMYTNYLSSDFAGNETPLAGITNLVLKDRIDVPLTKIELGGGSWNTWGGKVYNQGSAGGFNYFIGATYEKSNYTNYGTADSWLNMIQNPDYQKTKLYFKTTYFFDNDRQNVSLFANHAQHTGDAGRPNRDFDNNYDIVNAAYSYQISDSLNGQFKIGYRYYNREWGNDNYPPSLALTEKDTVKQTIIPADLAFNLKHWGNSLLTVGADYQHAKYQTFAEASGLSSTGNDSTSQVFGVYLQEKYIVDNWVLRAGVRYNDQKNSFNLISGVVPEVSDKSYDRVLWSAGVRFNASSQFSLFANAGSSFLAPSAKSVGGTLNAGDLGVLGKNGQLPNPGLQPESGIAFDLGLDYQITPSMLADVRGFFNKVDNAIVENVVSQNPSQSRSVNAGNTTAYGVEAQVKHYISDNFQWFANFTYTQTQVKNDLDRDQDGSNIPFVPNWMANAGITWKPCRWFVIVPYLHYVGNYYDSSSLSGRSKFGNYALLNAHMEGDITKNIRWNLNLNNITNEKFVMPWQFQDPGFNFYSSLQLLF